MTSWLVFFFASIGAAVSLAVGFIGLVACYCERQARLKKEAEIAEIDARRARWEREWATPTTTGDGT